MPIEKVDANVGWDGNNHTPLGGAGLDATYTLERQIGGTGEWETIDVRTLDDFGTAYTFSDQPFKTAADLEPYLTKTYIPDHYETSGTPPVTTLHCKGKEKSRTWDVTVNYRITETRPDGRYIDPDRYAGVREYTFSYHAKSTDACNFGHESEPWSPLMYTIKYQTTRGDSGTNETIGPTEDPQPEDLDYGMETFVNDEFRGELLIIKSNEQENPFKDSAQGGDKSNISRASYWTIKLLDGFEGIEYVHLTSETPAVSVEGTHIFAASRGVGIAKLLGVGDIADGGVKPYVEHLALGTLHGHGDTPVEVACHGAGLQVHVEPRLTLSIDVGAPLLVTIEDPLLQPLLILVERQVPVFRGSLHQSVTRVVLIGRVDEFLGRERGATLLTLVAVGALGTTTGAGADDVAVGQKLARHLVAILLLGDFLQLAVVIELAEEVGGKLIVDGAGRATIDVKRDTELLKRVLDQVMIAIDNLLDGDTLLAGTDRDGHAVLITSTNEDHILFLQSEIADIGVCRHIDACQMADMHAAIGVRQGRSHRSALEILFHIHAWYFVI